MTYKELLTHLKRLNKEALEQTATVYLEQTDEAIPVKQIDFTASGGPLDGVLDDGHVILTIDY